MIEQLNLAVRLVCVGAELVLLAVLLFSRARRPLKLAMTGLLIGTMTYLIHSEPQFGLHGPVRAGCDLISLFTPFWVWLFGLRLFERDPPARLVQGVAAWLIACWFVGNFVPPIWRVGFFGIHIASLILVADLFRNAWLGRDDDLIEKRRLIRTWLPLAIALQAAVVLAFELARGMDKPSPALQLSNAMFILLLTLVAAVALFGTERELLVESNAQPARRPRSSDELSPSEKVLLSKLEAAMAAGGYRLPGLTVSTLAARLEVPEHRLRALVNRRLGYRNFSAFLNLRRIEEAKAKLGDPAYVDLPVLTIAMDLGYNSLPTFNRAFRELAGCTPSDFRREAIGRE